jgi:acyl carrier protein
MTRPDADKTVFDAIRVLLTHRGEANLEVTPGANMADDLGFDSLELAELSAALEDDLGRDPYSEGIIPDTVAELVEYYKS